MDDSKIVVGAGRSGNEGRRLVSVESTLRFVTFGGAMVAALAAFDLVLAWYPLRLDNVAWRFTTLATSPTAFPTIGLGLVAAAGAAAAGDLGIGARTILGLANGAAAVLFAGMAIWLIFVFGQVSPPMEPEVLTGARKALLRGAVFGFGWGGLCAATAFWLHRSGQSEA